MTSPSHIENAIAELTGVTGSAGSNVWIYGQMNWAKHPAFDFTVLRGREWKQVEIMADQVRRYRDGETAFFLIEMSAVMATVLGIEHLILSTGEVDRLKRSIDTSKAW